jgi:hypothetical protein
MAKGLAVAAAVAALAIGGACRADITFSYTGSLQQYTIPTTATYSFTVAGAQGGDATPSGVGGLGTILSGDVLLTAGSVLDIVVGGMGGQGLRRPAGIQRPELRPGRSGRDPVRRLGPWLSVRPGPLT